jgi:hypothetical protein
MGQRLPAFAQLGKRPYGQKEIFTSEDSNQWNRHAHGHMIEVVMRSSGKTASGLKTPSTKPTARSTQSGDCYRPR